MLYIRIVTAFLFIISAISSCKKDSTSSTECFANAATIRKLSNVQATIKSSGGKFYLIEQGSIDSKLNPCTLAKEFQIENLQVIVSGDVKLTLHTDVTPCCTDDFIITKISK